jgi:hypothetical protein
MFVSSETRLTYFNGTLLHAETACLVTPKLRASSDIPPLAMRASRSGSERCFMKNEYLERKDLSNIAG